MREQEKNKLINILYAETNEEMLEQVKLLKTEEELYVLINNYNWDNGFELPNVVIQNPKCTLSVLLLAFYRADGLRYLLEGDKAFFYQHTKSWEYFIKDVYSKIINHEYVYGDISFQNELTKTEKFKIKKINPLIDPVFLNDISGKNLNIVL